MYMNKTFKNNTEEHSLIQDVTYVDWDEKKKRNLGSRNILVMVEFLTKLIIDTKISPENLQNIK